MPDSRSSSPTRCPGGRTSSAVCAVRGGGPALLLCGHSDVVAAPPALFTPARARRPHVRARDERHEGGSRRGAAAVRRLAADPPAGDVIVAAVVDEEWRSAGRRGTRPSPSAPTAAIVLESTGLDVVVEHGGFAWFELESTGVEAAGDDTEHGRDAIAYLGAALSEIAALDRRLAAGPAEPYGRPSVHVGTVAGGVQLSAWPGRAARGRRALPDGGRAAGRRARRDGRRRRARTRTRAGARARRAGAADAAGHRARRGRSRRAVARARRSPSTGRAAACCAATWAGWTPACWPQAGIPSVVFGPAGGGEHTDEEWVDLASVGVCAEVLVAAARSFCAAP